MFNVPICKKGVVELHLYTLLAILFVVYIIHITECLYWIFEP